MTPKGSSKVKNWFLVFRVIVYVHLGILGWLFIRGWPGSLNSDYWLRFLVGKMTLSPSGVLERDQARRLAIEPVSSTPNSGQSVDVPLDRPVIYREKPLAGHAGGEKPLDVKGRWQIAFHPQTSVRWTKTLVSKEVMDRLDFDTPRVITPEETADLTQVAAVYGTGGQALLLSSRGFMVFDEGSSKWAWSPSLGADVVRPQSGVLDRSSQSMWFFGENLYRYKLDTHEIEKWDTPDAAMKNIRWLGVEEDRLWLGTNHGLFRLSSANGTGESLKGDVPVFENPLVSGSLVAGQAWFVSEEGALLHILPNGAVELSDPLPPARPTSVSAWNSELWLILSEGGGLKSRLGVLSSLENSKNKDLTIFKDDVYLLRNVGDVLLGGGTVDLFAINTTARTVTPLPASVALSSHGVVFGGSTYEYTTSTYYVARHILDLSKGWSNANLNEWLVMNTNDTYSQKAMAQHPKPDLLGLADSGAHLWFWFPSAVWRLTKEGERLDYVKLTIPQEPASPFQVELAPVMVEKSTPSSPGDDVSWTEDE